MQEPVKLYAQLAIQSARSIDPLLNNSLMALDVDLSPNEHEELVKARDSALAALHSYADELEKRVPGMADFKPMAKQTIITTLSISCFCHLTHQRGNDRACRVGALPCARSVAG